MCGIFGSSSRKSSQGEVCKELITGLEKMEYRGYDSAGLCVLKGDSVLNYERSVGRVSNLKKKIQSGGATGDFIGIAHTRWATHGKSTETNAHPIRSDKAGTFFVVHNGIISNYFDLKSKLISKGYQFESQTDTEVAAKLALMYFEEDNSLTFIQIAKKVRDACQGGFAFILVSPKFPNEMCIIRQNIAVTLGINNPSSTAFAKKDGHFTMQNIGDSKIVVSSDILAIIEYTLNLVYLEEGDICHVSKDQITILSEDATGERRVSKAETSVDSVIKGAYSHFMLKEIHDQSESILNTLRNRVDFESKTILLESLKPKIGALSKATRYWFISCGTSFHSSLATKKVFEELTGKPVNVVVASHFLDHEPTIDSSDIVFFISQSGETYDSLSAMKYCKARGATTVGITNTPSSTMAKEASCNMDMRAGVEKGVASTKAYTSQFMSIILIALYISQNKKIKKERREEIIGAIEKLPSLVKESLKIDVSAFVNYIGDNNSMLIIGRGYQDATCFEGALKIKEISYIHSEAILAGELKHGPLALVSEDKSILFVVANDEFYEKSQSALEQVQARGASPFVICSEDISSKYPRSLSVPKTINCLQGLLMIIPFQKIAFELSVTKGFDPDFPRNLAKSVTVE